MAINFIYCFIVVIILLILTFSISNMEPQSPPQPYIYVLTSRDSTMAASRGRSLYWSKARSDFAMSKTVPLAKKTAGKNSSITKAPEIDTKTLQTLSKENQPITLEEIVDVTKSLYTYDAMLEDIASLKKRYTNRITIKSIGRSVIGKDLMLLIVGNPESDKKILVHGSIHGREYMTTLLIMKQIEFYLEDYDEAKYLQVDLKVLLDDVAIYYIPMCNPDGVSLSQLGVNGISDETLRTELIRMNEGSLDFSRWKANVRGVDLNRNFDAEWKKIKNYESPRSAYYKGTYPESEPETKAIADFTRNLSFDATISYHAKGNIIYWYFYQKNHDYSQDHEMAKELEEITGYDLVPPKVNPAFSGGYKDWYVSEFNNPGFTIEIGHPDSVTPLKIEEFPDIWNSNKFTSIHLAYLLYVQEYSNLSSDPIN